MSLKMKGQKHPSTGLEKWSLMIDRLQSKEWIPIQDCFKKYIWMPKFMPDSSVPSFWSWLFSGHFFEKIHPIPPWVKYCRPLKMVIFETFHTGLGRLGMYFLLFFLNEIF